MTTSKILPARPSLESLRKQAKKLAHEVAAGNDEAIARVRAQLSDAEFPLSQRNALLVLAREYGFAGWQILREEVAKRAGNELDWAAIQAEHAIHDNDVEKLGRLLTDHPALLSWRDDTGNVLLQATTSYAMDSRDPAREEMFNRPACAELLIDAGAVIDTSVWEHVIRTGASGMLQLLERKGVLPRSLPNVAALGDLDSVRGLLAQSNEPGIVNNAFMNACRFSHKPAAALLLDHSIALDPDLGRRIDAWQGRAAFVDYLCEHFLWHAAASPWRAFVLRQLTASMDGNDLESFAHWLQSEPWVLDEASIGVQVQLLERLAWMNREPFLAHLLGLHPAVLSCRTPPRSSALAFAMAYGNVHLTPLLSRIWPLPDDLPHAAGVGDLARVERWFDPAGQAALGDLDRHYSGDNPAWGRDKSQRILNVALAWACMNRHFDVAAFLLDHGADINTRWSTHEPASILHECAMHRNYEAAQFLIDHGIDLTILDHRWNATAQGWAYHAARDERMTELLAAAELRRMPPP